MIFRLRLAPTANATPQKALLKSLPSASSPHRLRQTRSTPLAGAFKSPQSTGNSARPRRTADTYKHTLTLLYLASDWGYVLAPCLIYRLLAHAHC